MKPFLQINNLSKTYPIAGQKPVEALSNVNLYADEGSFVSIIGPSGCGKSTLIKLIAGLEKPTGGAIVINGQQPQNGSERGIVFQDPSLFPWLNVEQNIGFALSLRKTPDQAKKKIVEHYMAVMGLREFRNAYPIQLSGGMQERVALARTLAINPKLLLLDEPFGSLDVQTKRFMGDLLLQIWSQEKRSIVFVTHDVAEAVFLSDVIYIMTPHPGTVRTKIILNLSRPRTLDTEFSPEFIKITRQIQEMITKESLQLMKLDLDIYKNL